MADRTYKVLARTWRPQKFDQVVGQSAIVRTLSNALEQGRVAHAYCFSGIRGVGKTTIARLLAKGLNCRSVDSPTASPCGTCEACVEIEESRNLDVLEMDAASQTGVDDIRQLNEFARYTPSRDRYRVFIIDEAHMLSASAFNALLKTLEEPPPHVIFMLATTEPHKILQTVLSRCQHYPLGRISLAEISARLAEIVEAEQVKLSDDGIALVAMAADGSLRDAQSLLDKLIAFGGDDIDDESVVSLLGMVDRELLFTVAELIGNQNLAGVFDFVNRMVEQGVDLHQFTLDLLGHFRALLVVATVEDAAAILHLPDGDLERLVQQVSMFEVGDLDRAFALLSASEYRIKQSEVPRYQLEMVLARLARMPRLEPLEALISELRSGSHGGTGRAKTAGSKGGAGSAGGAGSTGGAKSTGGAGNTGGARSADGAGNPGGAKGAEGAGNPGGAETAGPGRRAGAAESAPRATRPRGRGDGMPGSNGGATDPRAASARAAPAAGPGIRQSPEDEAQPASEARPPARPQASAGAVRVGADFGRVVERLRGERPLIAKIVERASSAELRDDTLFLTFEEAGNIFRARLRDRAALAAIEDAAEAALGRKIKVVAGFGSDEPGNGDAPDGLDLAPAAEAPEADEAAQTQRDELWRRAETEPLVQRFVDALRGNLTDVEEM